MTTDEDLIALKERAATELMRDPAVTGVGLGGRERDGRPTGEVVLKVFVERKRPLGELTPGEALPPRFEGLGVDVGELSLADVRLASQPVPEPDPRQVPGARQRGRDDTDSAKQPALTGGVRVQSAVDGGGFGTLGCLLEHRTADDKVDKVYALTNFHVVADIKGGHLPSLGTRVGHPLSTDSCVGRCGSDMFGAFIEGSSDTTRDAAIIQLDGGTKWLPEILEIGVLKGSRTVSPTETATGMVRVRKRGAHTRLTGGMLNAVRMTITVEGIRRTNVLVVRPNANPAARRGELVFFSQDGDSGSVLVDDDNKVIALHYAGLVSTKTAETFGFSLPIDDVLATFTQRLKVPTGTGRGQVQTAPGTRRAPLVGVSHPGVLPPVGDLLDRVTADLETAPGGGPLVELLRGHHAELLALINGRRPVTIAWHRSDGAAILHALLHAVADPALAMPRTINGTPPDRRVDRIHAALHASASPELRRALDRARDALPDLAGMTYPQMLAALARG